MLNERIGPTTARFAVLGSISASYMVAIYSQFVV